MNWGQRKTALHCLAVVVTMLLMNGYLLAATLNVPADYSTIQSAINAANDGDVIMVAAGTYDGTLNIVSKNNISIQGANKATTIVKSSSLLDWELGYGSSRKTVVRVVSSTNIDISGFTFDFDLIKGNNVSGVLYWDATGDLSNNNFQNMSVSDASGYYNELTCYVRAPSYSDGARAQVAFSSNTFSETGRLGIVSHIMSILPSAEIPFIKRQMTLAMPWKSDLPLLPQSAGTPSMAMIHPPHRMGALPPPSMLKIVTLAASPG